MARLDKVANSYAKAIFKYVGSEPSKVGPLVDEIQAFSRLIDEHKELAYVLTTELFSEEQRRNVVEDIAQKLGLSEAAKRVLRVLANNARLAHAGAIAEKLKLLALDSASVVPLRVESAISLDNGEKEKVEQRFHKILGKKVEASYVIDPTLIGGLRVIADGRVYDGSLVGWLESFEEKLVGGTI